MWVKCVYVTEHAHPRLLWLEFVAEGDAPMWTVAADMCDRAAMMGEYGDEVAVRVYNTWSNTSGGEGDCM